MRKTKVGVAEADKWLCDHGNLHLGYFPRVLQLFTFHHNLNYQPVTVPSEEGKN